MNDIIASILGGLLGLTMLVALWLGIFTLFKDDIIEIIREIKRKD